MSGSLNASAYLTSLFPSSGDVGSTMLNTIYGMGGSGSGSVDPIAALQQAEQDKTRQEAMTAAQPQVKLALAQFTKGVQSAKTVDQLLSNPAVMNVLLTAGGMSDQIGFTALATKVLTSNLSDPKSLANTLTDARWKTLAQTYDFHANGLSKIQSASTLASVTSAYVQTEWETNQDSITPGLANALYFKTQGASIKSIDQILGDPTLRTVVTTALNIPKQIAFQTLGAQENAISSRLNIKDFQNPTFVDSFVKRYLIANSGS